jgi:hypothetical protein
MIFYVYIIYSQKLDQYYIVILKIFRIGYFDTIIQAVRLLKKPIIGNLFIQFLLKPGLRQVKENLKLRRKKAENISNG